MVESTPKIATTDLLPILPFLDGDTVLSLRLLSCAFTEIHTAYSQHKTEIESDVGVAEQNTGNYVLLRDLLRNPKLSKKVSLR